MFDRVLSGDREKGLRQFVGRPSDGRFTFLHRLEQCGLSFWGGPVDLVGKQNIRKNRTFDEPEFATSGVVLFQDIRSGDVRWH